MVKVKFSLRNVRTGAVKNFVRKFRGQAFHAITGTLISRITKLIPKLLKGEAKAGWVINGFQDWEIWHARKTRAQEGDQ